MDENHTEQAGELRYACHLLESAIDELNHSGLQDPGALLLLRTAAIAPYMDVGTRARAVQAGGPAPALAPRVSDAELPGSATPGPAPVRLQQPRSHGAAT
ncbi:hypothetical protein [Streptomyces finlayi]|uniref:hypothetical protein n=1 Tax=Streptomyces finlayi TaxID=67296 RepID=UPI0035BC064F